MFVHSKREKMSTQKFDIIYFSIDKWGKVKKRPHHFAKELSKDRKVLFVEDAPPLKRRVLNIMKGNIVHLSKLNRNLWQVYLNIRLSFKFKGFIKIKCFALKFNHKVLWHFLKKTVGTLEFSDIVVLGNDIYLYPINEVCSSSNFNSGRILEIVYDCVDEHRAFPDADYDFANQVEQKLSQNSDIVFFTAKKLMRKPEMIGLRNTYYIPNGVEYEKFISPCITPTEFSQVKTNSIIFGYTGAITEWVDFEMMEEILNMDENYAVCLIGGFLYKNEEKHFKNKISKISQKYRNRFLFLGVKPYEELPPYIKSFDICLIPFKLREVTQSALPIKTFEYLAAGKGVISTRWKEMEQFSDIISLVSNKKELKTAVAHEVALINNEEIRKKRMDFAKNYDWNKIVKNSVEIISGFIKCKQDK